MAVTPRAGDIADVVKKIRKDLDATMRANPLATGATISSGGLTGIDPTTGHKVFFLGLGPFSDGSDRKQMETVLFRADGTIAFSVADFGTTPGHAYEQAVALWDRNNRIVVSDDTVSGHGLGTPHIGVGLLQDTNVANWPATTASTFTTIASCFWEVQNPKLQWAITLEADTGVTAEFQLLTNGTQIGTTQTVTAGGSAAFDFWQPGPTSYPGGITVGDIVSLSLQARVTAGAGSARAINTWLSGAQS